MGFDTLCKKIFDIDKNIRFAGVIGKMGKLEAGGMRKGLEPLEPDKSAQGVYMDFALRTAMRHDFDPVFGSVVYTFSEREKIKFVTFPLHDNIVLVSIEKGKPHGRIIKEVLKLVEEAAPAAKEG